MILVLDPGARTLVQDLGRPGLAHLGVGPSGAADTLALRRANGLAGNVAGAAVLEVLLGGLVLEALAPAVVAVAGADCGLPPVVSLRTGEVLRLGRPSDGLLTYLAVAGGFDVPRVLGSCSTDTLGRVGPPAVRAGDQVAVGRAVRWVDPLELAPRLVMPGAGPVVVRVHPGPRPEVFDDGLAELCRASWTVSASADRTGVRLDGPAVPRRTGEAEPEGLVLGAVQVPPDGRPIVMLADHPVTGGYPVVAVVHADDVRLVAQSRPGTALRFVPVR